MYVSCEGISYRQAAAKMYHAGGVGAFLAGEREMRCPAPVLRRQGLAGCCRNVFLQSAVQTLLPADPPARPLIAGVWTIVLGGIPRDASCFAGTEGALRAMELWL